MTASISHCFNTNFKYLKVFGVWPGQDTNRYYKFYSIIFLVLNLFIYNILLTLNLAFTPWKIELLIREIIFYFTEIAVTVKVFMILLMRNEILQVLDILDCKAFRGGDDASRQIVGQHVPKYRTGWKMFSVLCNISYLTQVFIPILVYLIFSNASLELPICKYYFLSPETLNKYFVFWYIYQSAGMYAHMQYNIGIDTLMAGFIYMAIVQVKILNSELRNLTSVIDQPRDDYELNRRFLKCIKHYQKLLSYCAEIQNIISVTMFVQFSMASVILCVVLCQLTLPSSTETFLFMIGYMFAMTLQIFIPAWLGTQLRHESQELVFAAYSSYWISRPEKYKNMLKLFMQRANSDIKFFGWRMFSLSLDTFVAIIKMAYSFFTLVRNVQDRQVN